jgi:hypothetical protein
MCKKVKCIKNKKVSETEVRNLGIECETKFQSLHDEIERMNEEIREIKSEIQRNKIHSWSTSSGKRIVTKAKRK